MNTPTQSKKRRNDSRHIRLHDRLRNHPFVIPVITFLALFFITIAAMISLGGSTIGASDSRLVYLTMDGKKQAVPTRSATVSEMLQKLNVTIYENDVVEPSLDTPIITDNLSVNIYRARPVTVIDGNRTEITFSADTSPKQIATKAGIVVYPEDRVVKSTSTELIDKGIIGEVVTVERSKPAIINLYGTDIPIRTLSKTVGDVLKEKNIATQNGDTVTPAITTPIVADTKIFISRFGKKIDTREETIAPAVQTQNDASVPSGSTVVKQAGKPGKKVVTYEVELNNDKEISRRVIQEIVIEQAVPQIVLKGTKLIIAEDRLGWLKASSIAPDQYASADYIIGKESGWRPGATNYLGCIGLGQSCPSRSGIAALSVACPSWQIDPVCQLNFFNNYANSRYGSWDGAYSFWQRNRWW